MGSLRAEQVRMKSMLTEAITMLCKSGLNYRSGFTVEGLLGITLDNNDIILVNIQETFKSHPSYRQEVESDDVSASHVDTNCNIRDMKQKPSSDAENDLEGAVHMVPAGFAFAKPTETAQRLDYDDVVSSLNNSVGSDICEGTSGVAGRGKVCHSTPLNTDVKQEPSDLATPAYPINVESVELPNLKPPPPLIWAPNPSPISSQPPSERRSSSSPQNIYASIKGASTPGRRKRPCPRKISKSTSSGSPRGSVKQHVVNKMGTNIQVISSVKYACGTCGKEFMHANSCFEHERAHRGLFKYTCKVCGKGFRSSNNYNGHMSKHNGSINEYCCTFCPVRFAYSSGLRMHMKKKHSDASDDVYSV